MSRLSLGGPQRAKHNRGTLVAGGSFRTFVSGWCLCALLLTLPVRTAAADPRGGFPFKMPGRHVNPSYVQRQQVITDLPMQRLTPHAQERILAVAQSPTLYRRLPTQAISCDRDMFLFLTRHPEVLVGIWDLMGITNVRTQRIGPYQLAAQDGSGTDCQVDLVYGDPSLHIYVAQGSYDGTMVAKPIRGKGVFILRSSYAQAADGRTTVTGTLDCFVQIESLGADLIARTLSRLIGRSADHNFIETARFMSQVSLASERNPSAMMDVAQRMSQIDEATRQQFIHLISTVAQRDVLRMDTARRTMAIRSRSVGLRAP